MDNLLNTYEIKEEIIVENKQAYAYSSILNSKRKISGCDAREYIAEFIDEETKKKEELEKKLKETIAKLTKYQTLDNQLAVAGYCKKDNPVYQKIDGLVVKDSSGQPKIAKYTHANTCKHKEV